MTKLQLERKIKGDLDAFLKAEPARWQTAQGPLTVAERRQRLAFADQYTALAVKDWLTGRGLELGDLVDSDPALDRWDFVRLVTGGQRWEELEARHVKS